jgi:hypothetical protein
VIPWWKRLSNLEKVFIKHEETIKSLEERIEELEQVKDGKSCIGFFDDDITGDYLEGVR